MPNSAQTKSTTVKKKAKAKSPKTTSTKTIAITDLQQAMHANLPNLVANKDYTLEQIVGKTFWKAIPKSERNTLGQVFKALVNKGGQPVTWNGDRTDNCQIYQLK